MPVEKIDDCKCGGIGLLQKNELGNGDQTFAVCCNRCRVKTSQYISAWDAVVRWNELALARSNEQSTLEQVAPYATRAEVEELRASVIVLLDFAKVLSRQAGEACVKVDSLFNALHDELRNASTAEYRSKEAEECES